MRSRFKKKKVVKAINLVPGTKVKEAGKIKGIDAMTGATRYQKRLYANFELLSRKIIEHMDAPPAWPKKPMK